MGHIMYQYIGIRMKHVSQAMIAFNSNDCLSNYSRPKAVWRVQLIANPPHTPSAATVSPNRGKRPIHHPLCIHPLLPHHPQRTSNRSIPPPPPSPSPSSHQPAQAATPSSAHLSISPASPSPDSSPISSLSHSSSWSSLTSARNRCRP